MSMGVDIRRHNQTSVDAFKLDPRTERFKVLIASMAIFSLYIHPSNKNIETEINI